MALFRLASMIRFEDSSASICFWYPSMTLRLPGASCFNEARILSK